MATVRTYQHSFAVGVHDTTALPRIDLERMRLAAEVQTNFLAKTSGPGFMRPGLEHINTASGITRLKDFVFGATDASAMKFANQTLEIITSDVAVTRPTVTAAVTSGTFAASTGWTLAATDGATSAVSGGFLNLTAEPRGSSASATQTVAVNEQGTEHALRIVIDRGPVLFRCGSTSGGDEYVSETSLATGTHSLAFTPSTSNFYIQFKSDRRNLKRVDSIVVESAGVMSLPTPWLAADLGKMRFGQSADVVFVACRGYQQRRIERRSARSWSVVLYHPDDGPFTVDRTRRVKLKCSVTEGNGTLTADSAFFTANHVGALFKLFNEGQRMSFILGASGVYTDPIRVTGVTSDTALDRDWYYTITGTWVASIWNQRSFDGPDTGYVDYRNANGGAVAARTSNASDVRQQDNDDNAIIHYRLGIKEGDYASGAATVDIDYDGGGGFGICRVVGYTSATQVSVEVLRPFFNTTYTDRWQEGEWSAAGTYPSAVCFADGRLWWSGEDRLWGSVSDAFESFDEDLEGDAGPVSRSIATGGVNDTQWLLALQRLLIGTEGAIAVAKSSSLDEPITPTNLSIRDSSTTGASAVDPIKIDSRGMFIERDGKAVLELTFDGASAEYSATQLSKLTTDLFSSGVKEVAVQRRPDTRVWLVMNDGSCVCVLYEPGQEVLAFIPIETDGDFESVAVLPAEGQDRVYFVVNRTINSSTVRYIEKMAMDSETRPATLCKVMDAFKSGTNGPASATVAVGTHLVGETVVVWADGAPVETSQGVRGEYVVDGSGNITLANAVTDWVAGLPYRARYKSARLAYGGDGGSALLKKKTIDDIGLIIADYTRHGIRLGQDFDTMYPLPLMVDGSVAAAVVSGVPADAYPFSTGGYWDTDCRACFEISSPYTMTALGMVLQIQTNG
jgi:hypothetical protein